MNILTNANAPNIDLPIKFSYILWVINNLKPIHLIFVIPPIYINNYTF